MNDISLYTNCWPRQIRGPALNGMKIYGFLVTYLLEHSSSQQSGSNSSASGPQRSVRRCIMKTE